VVRLVAPLLRLAAPAWLSGLLAAALGAAGCMQGYGSAPFACSNGICPEGYHCVAKVCRQDGSEAADLRGWENRRTNPRKDGGAVTPADQRVVASGWTCAQVLDCQDQCVVGCDNKCGPNDPCFQACNDSCQDACFGHGSSAAKLLFDQLLACDVSHYCPDAQNFYQCEAVNCSKQLTDCGL
jgi:hypothetical protein